MSSISNSQIAEIDCLLKELTKKVEELKMTQNELKNDFKIVTYPINKKMNVQYPPEKAERRAFSIRPRVNVLACNSEAF